MNCRSLIGMELSEATAAIEAEGAEYTVVANDSDKQKTWDAELVVRAAAADGKYELTTSRFLFKVK